MASEPRQTKQNKIVKTTIIINGKPEVKDIPVSWDQVSFRQLLALEKTGKAVEQAISILTGIEYDVLLKAKIKDMDQVIAVLGFLNSPAQPFIPTSICNYPIPKNLEFEEVKQYVDLKVTLDESVKLTPTEQLEKYTLYCAIYACKARHGKYEIELAEAMAPEFLEAPCTEVLGIGNFTLLKLAALSQHINLSSPKALTLGMKLKLVLTNWRLTLAHIQRLFLWRRKQGQARKNC
jgi:hypothetical protein